METSDCAAALEPSIFHSSGGKELQRFVAGAHARNETALVVATIGNADDDSRRWPLATTDASISLPEFRGSISGMCDIPRTHGTSHILVALTSWGSTTISTSLLASVRARRPVARPVGTRQQVHQRDDHG
jgi:hypothetical protein